MEINVFTAALEILCGVGLFEQPWSTLNQQEYKEITHGEKGNHLCDAVVTREGDFRNDLLL